MTSNDEPASIHRIAAEDLSNNDRLAELYVDAVRRRYWRNSPQAALEFATLAEKALADDKHGTPGALFVALLKSDSSSVTLAAETRAMQRWPSELRYALVEAAASTHSEPDPVTQGDVDDALATVQIGYSHAALMQCFLPHRDTEARQWVVSHGLASLRIEAGGLADPNNPGQWLECAVPSGAKSRLILSYIIGEAVRTATPEIDLGRSLRAFMARLGVPVAGSNAAALTTQVQNIAAATILLGEWEDNQVRTRGARFADEFSFWIERVPDQQCFWSPTMTLSDKFHAAIQKHRVPIHMGHLAQLARSPRRMDVYAWLSYRTPTIPRKDRVAVSLRALHTIFGPDITRPRDFKQRLHRDLAAIATVYPAFRVDISNDIVWLARSPPPVPYTPFIHSANQLPTV